MKDKIIEPYIKLSNLRKAEYQNLYLENKKLREKIENIEKITIPLVEKK